MSSMTDFVVSYSTGRLGEPRATAWAVTPRAMEACETFNINDPDAIDRSYRMSDFAPIVEKALIHLSLRWDDLHIITRSSDEAKWVAADLRAKVSA